MDPLEADEMSETAQTEKYLKSDKTNFTVSRKKLAQGKHKLNSEFDSHIKSLRYSSE